MLETNEMKVPRKIDGQNENRYNKKSTNQRILRYPNN